MFCCVLFGLAWLSSHDPFYEKESEANFKNKKYRKFTTQHFKNQLNGTLK